MAGLLQLHRRNPPLLPKLWTTSTHFLEKLVIPFPQVFLDMYFRTFVVGLTTMISVFEHSGLTPDSVIEADNSPLGYCNPSTK